MSVNALLRTKPVGGKSWPSVRGLGTAGKVAAALSHAQKLSAAFGRPQTSGVG